MLRVAENVNEGWQARLDGQRLETVTLDGWQQGYRVPAGAGGTISLVYAPDTQYRVGLLLGGLLALLLLLAAVLGSALPAVRARDANAGPGPRPDAEVRGEAPATGRWQRLTGAGAGAALLLLGGPVAAAGFVAAAARRRTAWAWPAGAALVLVSAVLSAVSPSLRFGRPGILADAAAAAGVGLLLGSSSCPVRPGPGPGRHGRGGAAALRPPPRGRTAGWSTSTCSWPDCCWSRPRPRSGRWWLRARTSGRTTSCTSTSPRPSGWAATTSSATTAATSRSGRTP